MGTPSEISPKLFDIEIMIGSREGVVEVAVILVIAPAALAAVSVWWALLIV